MIQTPSQRCGGRSVAKMMIIMIIGPFGQTWVQLWAPSSGVWDVFTSWYSLLGGDKGIYRWTLVDRCCYLYCLLLTTWIMIRSTNCLPSVVIITLALGSLSCTSAYLFSYISVDINTRIEKIHAYRPSKTSSSQHCRRSDLFRCYSVVSIINNHIIN